MFPPTDGFRLNGNKVSFTKGPSGFLYAEEGKAGKLYRVEVGGELKALKTFWPIYQESAISVNARKLKKYQELPGMGIVNRDVLTEESNSELIGNFPELRNAVVMPWIEGKLWANYLNEKFSVTEAQSLEIAHNLAVILANLEINGLAHCDIASKNVIIGRNGTTMELLDIEEMYGQQMVPPPPDCVPAGAPGYLHPEVAEHGAWNRYGDRFAGGVMLAEMLGWCDLDVREIGYPDGSYFNPDEIREEGERYNVLLGSLRKNYGELIAGLFHDVWTASRIMEIPSASDWIIEINHQIRLKGECDVHYLGNQIMNKTRNTEEVKEISRNLLNTGITVYTLSHFVQGQGSQYKLYVKEDGKFAGYLKEDGTLTDGTNAWSSDEILAGIGFSEIKRMEEWVNRNGLTICRKNLKERKKISKGGDLKWIALIGAGMIGFDIFLAASTGEGTTWTYGILGLAMLIVAGILRASK